MSALVAELLAAWIAYLNLHPSAPRSLSITCRAESLGGKVGAIFGIHRYTDEQANEDYVQQVGWHLVLIVILFMAFPWKNEEF